MIDDRSDVSDRRAFTERSIVHRGRLALQIQPSIGQFPGEVPWQTFSKRFLPPSSYEVVSSATGVKKERWSLRRRKTRKYMRDTSDHNRDVSTNLSKRGTRDTHGAARRDNRRDFSDHPVTPLPFFISSRFPHHLSTGLYIYIYPMYLFLTFVSHDEIFFSKVFEPSNLDRQANYGKEEVIPIINQWGLTIWNSISLSLDFSSDRGTIRSFSHLFGNNARR